MLIFFIYETADADEKERLREDKALDILVDRTIFIAKTDAEEIKDTEEIEGDLLFLNILCSV